MSDKVPKPAGAVPDEPQTSGDSTKIRVKVYAPFRVYFEGLAESVSAASQTGPFDILKGHHNFITLLVPCDIVVRTGKEDEVIRIQGGIMHVKADSVIVFLDV
ncbi:MAG: hypothetical protein WBP03_04640 [Candidatus Saccharimonadales bacterium]